MLQATWRSQPFAPACSGGNFGRKPLAKKAARCESNAVRLPGIVRTDWAPPQLLRAKQIAVGDRQVYRALTAAVRLTARVFSPPGLVGLEQTPPTCLCVRACVIVRACVRACKCVCQPARCAWLRWKTRG